MVEKIKEIYNDLDIYIQDIIYETKIKNKKVKRNERIIYFGKSGNLIYLNKEKCEEFFLDITFNIIPKNFRPYKLLIISGIPYEKKNPVSICFILIKFQDFETYNKIFNFLFENFKFIPQIIHSDFELAIAKAIKENKYFQGKVYHSRCFFHFAQMIKGKMQKLKLCNKKFNKVNIEIIRNLEMLCFLKIENINKFKNIILEKLDKNKNYNSFF